MLYIVIPAFNEAKRIVGVIGDCLKTCPEAGIVVVDDASTDDTIRRAAATGVTVITHVVNRGQGAALRTGTAYALAHGAHTIAHFDADGQFEAEDILRAVELMRTEDADVVLGSRFLTADGGREMPAFKRLILRTAARAVNRMLTGVWLTDAHNGFRVLSRRAASLITITQDRMAHNSDIVRQIRMNKLRFVETPVTVHYHEYGQRLSDGFKIVYDLIIGKLL